MILHDSVKNKVYKKHKLTLNEIQEAFENPLGNIYEDNRSEHKTTPPTLWFIGETLYGKKIKIVYIAFPDKPPVIKSAYEPEQPTKELYKEWNLKDGLKIEL